MLRCIAIAKETKVLDLLSRYAIEAIGLSLQKTFTSQEQAVIYLEKFPVDLIFIDIKSGFHSGMDFYSSLSVKPQVIFLAKSKCFAAEAFAIGATDYLLKPFSVERFQQATAKARLYFRVYAQSNETASSCLLIRSACKLVKINFSAIEYIRGWDDYIKIFLFREKPVLSHISLKDVLEKLPVSQFTRVHRSFIIPVDKVTRYRGGHIFMGERKVPVGKTYLPAIKKILGT